MRLNNKYVAGIVDGEGSFCISKVAPQGGRIRPTYRLYLQVTNQNLFLLESLKETYGVGSIVIGTTAYHWIAANRQAETVIRKIRKHLIIKQEQAHIALLFRRVVNRRGYGSYSKKLENSYDAKKYILRNRMMEQNVVLSRDFSKIRLVNSGKPVTGDAVGNPEPTPNDMLGKCVETRDESPKGIV